MYNFFAWINNKWLLNKTFFSRMINRFGLRSNIYQSMWWTLMKRLFIPLTAVVVVCWPRIFWLLSAHFPFRCVFTLNDTIVIGCFFYLLNRTSVQRFIFIHIFSFIKWERMKIANAYWMIIWPWFQYCCFVLGLQFD